MTQHLYRFIDGWNSVGDTATRVGIQLMSNSACRSSIVKSFSEAHTNFAANYVSLVVLQTKLGRAWLLYLSIHSWFELATNHQKTRVNIKSFTNFY